MSLKKRAIRKKKDEVSSLLEHIEELRKRLIYCVIAVGVCSIAVSRFVPLILAQLKQHVGTLVFISPTEAFWAHLKLAVGVGFYGALPFVLYQLFSFIRTGLYDHERKYLVPFSVAAFFLFTAGASFSYFIVLPLGVKFLLSYSGGVIQPMISVNSYLSLVLTMLFSFGFIFELPLAAGILTYAGVLHPQVLTRYRRMAVVGIFIAAALLTPPDVITQIFLAVPLLGLYEASIAVSRLIHSKTHRA